MAKRRVSLQKCPPGPFIFDGRLGFKTEYGAMSGKDVGGGRVEWTVSDYPEAYCMDTGEVFWGGATNHEARARLMVEPVEVSVLS